MAEYISRDDALLHSEIIEVYTKDYGNIDVVPVEYLADIPSADVQPTKWISVKDRLPDKLCECLGVVEGKVTEVSYRPKQKEFICVWSMCDADGFKPLSDDAVTHWMPLPKPPKDGEQNE